MSDNNSRVGPISGPGLVVNYLVDGSLQEGILFNYEEVDGEVDDPLAIVIDTEDDPPELVSRRPPIEAVAEIQFRHQQLLDLTFQNCAALNNRTQLLHTHINVEVSQLEASLEKKMSDGFKKVGTKFRTVDRKVKGLERPIKMQGIAIQQTRRRQEDFDSRMNNFEMELRLLRGPASARGRQRIVRVRCRNCGKQVGQTYLSRHRKTQLCVNNAMES